MIGEYLALIILIFLLMLSVVQMFQLRKADGLDIVKIGALLYLLHDLTERMR